MEPKKRLAIVTGASSGIGEAIARNLAKSGMPVVVTARRKEKLEALAASIKTDGGKALPVQADAALRADTDRLLHDAENFARQNGAQIDIIIVNAGRGLAGGVLSSDLAQWEEVYATNVTGALYLMRRAAEILAKRQSGDIIVLGSVAGHNISPFSGFYGSTKWAIWSAAEALRREICGKGVRVTTIKPAIVLSEFQSVAGYTEENFGKNAKRFGKLLEPSDVANAIEFIVTQPPHIHISDLIIRPTGQDYP
jgi:NADP-dependent 3-hydroxy acid dehydrogenase YdfG